MTTRTAPSYGARNPDGTTLESANNLAADLHQLGLIDEAEPAEAYVGQRRPEQDTEASMPIQAT
jgi:hypothetical protein